MVRFRDDDTPSSISVPEVELTKEKELALVLKASSHTPLKEQAARAASILFEDVVGNFTNSSTFFIFYCHGSYGVRAL